MSATIGTPPPTRAINLNNGELTASAPFFSGAQTWNNAGTVFTASVIDVTDTASASGSSFVDYKVGGVSKLRFGKGGEIVRNGGSILDSAGNLYGTALYFPGAASGIRQISSALLEVNNGTPGNVGTLITKLRLETDAPPTDATDPGTTGQIRYDADFIYLCVATDTWVRSPLSTW